MTSPSRIGAAVIGSGFIGTVHVEALRRLGVQVHGLLGSSPERAAQRAEQLGVPRGYASLDELLSDDRVEVVHVTSPNHLHHDQVREVLAAGRHVVCEKPLAMTSEESADLVRLAADSGRVAAVNFNIRFYPLNQHARELVAGGASATSGWSRAGISRTGCCTRPIGTGASSPIAAGRFGRWVTSAHIGSTS